MSYPAQGPDRLPPLDPGEMSQQQHAAVAAIVSGPRGELVGPFIPLLRNPALMEPIQKLGAHLRYDGVLPDDLRELAILVTARHWHQKVEWNLHVPIARAAGLPRAALAAIAAGEAATLEGVRMHVLEFCRQLLVTQGVSDAVFDDVKGAIGEDGLVELVGLCGYYSVIAMMMNVARTPSPHHDYSIPD